MLFVPWMGFFAHRKRLFYKKKQHRYRQAMNLRFLSIKVPKSMASSSSDIKADDHIQDMKQVVEIMNQVYKNVYAIYENNRANRTFG